MSCTVGNENVTSVDTTIVLGHEPEKIETIITRETDFESFREKRKHAAISWQDKCGNLCTEY